MKKIRISFNININVDLEKVKNYALLFSFPAFISGVIIYNCIKYGTNLMLLV
jgi:hypothetical protein